jgi:hypothetical protein
VWPFYADSFHWETHASNRPPAGNVQRCDKIYFYATATAGTWGSGILADHDLQSTTVAKPEGEFTLVHGMLGQGCFHLVLADPERYSRMFANVYFGTGENVLRQKKP